MDPKTWVVVGPGAVGQVLALALQRAGERPLLLGRKTPKARKGKTRTGPGRIRDEDEGVPAVLAEETFVTEFPAAPPRAVILAVRSDQLPGCLAEWGEDIRRSGAPLIFLQPGFSDRERIEKAIPTNSLVQGNPGFLAYFEPEGTLRYWTYAMVPTLLAPVRGPGAGELVRDFRHILRLGRLPARRTADVAADVQALVAWVVPYLAALQEVGYSFDELCDRPDLLELAARAGDEGHRAACETMPRVGWIPRIPGWIPPVVSATAARFVLGLLDARLRAMWEVHAAKIQDQTREMVEELIQRAAGRGLATPHLIHLHDLVWSEL